MGGIGESLLLVAFCGSCTFLTTISLSAIATNGAMKVRKLITVIKRFSKLMKIKQLCYARNLFLWGAPFMLKSLC